MSDKKRTTFVHCFFVLVLKRAVLSLVHPHPLPQGICCFEGLVDRALASHAEDNQIKSTKSNFFFDDYSSDKIFVLA
jgi:hypothetical protein